jgi:hypothetical protein
MGRVYRQVELRSETRELVTNLEDHPKLRVGNSLTLADHDEPERRWDIVWVSDVARERADLKTRWNVGGLF